MTRATHAQLNTFLERVCPDAMGSHLGEHDGARIHEEKLLMTLIDLRGEAMTLDENLAGQVAREREMLRRIAAWGEEIVADAPGDARILKGSRYARLYPPGIARYQKDLDVLFAGEAAYVRCLDRMITRGMAMKACHLTRAQDGGLYASAIFFESDDGVQRRSDGLAIELHCRAFPITPFTHIDLQAPTVSGLSGQAWDVLVLLAEFVYRDGRRKRFVHRDVLDTLLLFSQLEDEDIAAVADAVEAHALWVAVGLLRAHAREYDGIAWPASLRVLFEDPRCTEPPEAYDLFEHQALPSLRMSGRTRADFESMIEAYRRINPGEGGVLSPTPFEIGMEFARGVPVACRRTVGNPGHTLLDACEVIAGPPEARVVVHTRIGAQAPCPPQCTLGPSTSARRTP